MLSRRLFLFAAAACVPLVALLAYGLYLQREDATRSARQTVMQMARAASGRHRRLVERSQNVAAILAALPAVQRGDVPLVNTLFGSVVRNFPEYPNVRLSNPDGDMIASALPNEPASSNRGRDWFDEVLRTSSYAMSGYFVGVTTGRPVVVLGYPVLASDGAIRAVLSITIDLAGLADVPTGEVPAGAAVTIIGRSGMVLASSAASDATHGEPLDRTLLDAIRSGPAEGVLETTDRAGRRSLVGYVSLPVAPGSEGMYIAVGVPQDHVLAPLNHALLLSGGGVFLVVAFVFSVGAVGGRRLLVSPVRALRDTMSQLATGDASARPPESLRHDRSEFGDLARSLDSLAVQLQLRQSAQAIERERLRAILDAYVGYVVVVARDGSIEEINLTPLTLLGLTRADVIGKPLSVAAGLGAAEAGLVNRLIARAFDGETARGELVSSFPGIGERTVDWVFSPLMDTDGAMVHVVGFAIDVTEQRRAEETVRTRERELAAIYSNAADVLFQVAVEADGRFRFVSVNPAFTRATGVPAGQVVGRFIDDIIPEQSLAEVLGHYRTAVETKQVVSWSEVSNHPSGRRFGLVSVSPVLGPDGRCTHLVGSIHDFTDARESQEALHASEERLRLALRASRQGFYDLDLKSGAVATNDDYALMLGYPPDTFAETHLDWIERLHPDERERIRAAFDAYVRGDAPTYEVEFRQRTRTGEWRWVQSVGAIVARDHDGRPTRLIGTHVDITGRVEAEAAVRQSEARLREAQRLSRIGDWELDIPSGRLQWSDELFRIFEINPEEFGASYEAFLGAVHPDDRAMVDNAYSSSLRDHQPYRLVHRLLLSDGRVRHVEERCETDYASDGTPLRSRGTAQDITDRIRVEEALRSSEANLRRAESLALLGHFEFDQAGSDAVWSDGLKRLFGLHGEEQPTAQYFAERIHPEDRARLADGIRGAVKDGRPFESDVRIARSDGTELFVRARGELARNASTGQTRAFGAVLDISGLKRAEQRLTELNATLEQRVVDRTRELEATNRELEAFSYSVSHDLRAPLRAIDGFSLAVLEDEADRLSPAGRADLLRVRAAAQRMGELIDAMLRMSRLLREPMDVEAVDVTSLCRQVAAELARNRRAPCVRVEDNLVVRGDRRLLRAALTNLIENALKFSSDVPCSEVEIGSLPDARQQVLFVRDNGAGFDMAYADKLFVPFERLHPPGQFAGSGIGLATVHRIVARHGGRIWADSRPGHGATFFVALDRP